MTNKDDTPTMAVYVRDTKAMFLIRGGKVVKLGGNWRRMHILTRRDGQRLVGRAIESSGAQKVHILPYRRPIASLVESAIGKMRSLDDLGHIPLF
jgi:hypothetical protein